MQRLWILFWFTASTLWAAGVNTSITEVSHDSDLQVIGSFTITVDGNDFSEAGPTSPVYIRFQMANGNGWSKTLVDLRPSAEPIFQHPINIAVSPVSSAGTLNPGLGAEAVQLVRLIEGETAGWLRINASTAIWMSNAGEIGAPTRDAAVSFTVGVTGDNSQSTRANTLSGGNETPNGFLISTVLRVDYRDTPNFDVDDVETLSFIAFDSSTFGVESGDTVLPGSNTGAGFSRESNVARGVASLPCFEFHTEFEDFDSSNIIIGMSRQNLFWRDTFCAPLSPLFLSNSSDFDWEPGSTMSVILPELDPTQVDHPLTQAPEIGNIRLTETELTLTPAGDETWEVRALKIDDVFVGYAFTLTSGIFPKLGRLQIDGAQICSENWFENQGYFLRADATFIQPKVNNEPTAISPITKRMATVFTDEGDFQRQILPYTGYDRTEEGATEITFINRSNQPATFTAFFYQRQGIHTRSVFMQTLPPYGSYSVDPVEAWGENFARTLVWAEILSDGPISAVGFYQDAPGRQFDAFASVPESQEQLYGPHVPTNTEAWTSRAYVIASEYDVDSDFELVLPSQTRDLDILRAPRYGATIEDGDLFNGGERATWLQINATDKTASGLFTFEPRDAASQMASISMNAQPSSEWRFDHLGDVTQGWWNGVILFNPNSEPVQVTLTARSESGASIGSSSLTVPANTRIAEVVANYFSGPVSRLEAQAGAEIVGGMLIGRVDQEILTAVPGNLPAGNHFIAPFPPYQEGRWAGLALINTRSNPLRGSITVVDAEGQALRILEYVVPPNGKSLLLQEGAPNEAAMIIDGNLSLRVYGITGNQGQLATLPIFTIE